MPSSKINLLFPFGEENFKKLSDVAFHDLGIEFICEKVTEKREERFSFSQIFQKMTDNPEVSAYRIEVFDDIFENPGMSAALIEQLEKINYEKQFSGFSGHFEETNSAWELLHRLEEINAYIQSIEAIYKCLSSSTLKSEGLNNLKDYVNKLYNDNGFSELKKDILELKASTKNLKSVTLGVNLNEKFEAHGIGLVSFNKKEFTKSAAIGQFISKVAEKDSINENSDWNDDYKFIPIEAHKTDIFEKILSISGSNDPRVENSTFYMDKIANSMISGIVHKLKTVLKKYVYLPVTDITDLIPQFVFYIRFAEYIKRMQAKGFKFCKPEIALGKAKYFMSAKSVYNFKLLSAFEGGNNLQSGIKIAEEKNISENNGLQDCSANEEIVSNDLDFDKNHLVYIFTGANRGGKTTFTQAVGLLFVLAQAGLYVPGESFVFNPVDSIYTHFPADEDKTMDLGRLGEECKRFKEMYSASTESSLLLMNETYSTTSFEEGFYIAKDSVRAILKKGVRTIYNTHMHKLAFDLDEINAETSENDGEGGFKAASLIVKAENGARTFKVQVAPPEGISFAKDIAEKYGVTFEMLTNSKD